MGRIAIKPENADKVDCVAAVDATMNVAATDYTPVAAAFIAAHGTSGACGRIHFLV
jgi:hypothetical protein